MNFFSDSIACVYREQKQSWPFALAFEGVAHRCNRTAPGTFPVDAAKKIIDAQGLDWSLVAGCFGTFDAKGMPPKGSLGYTLGAAAAATTGALSPSHTGVPWVTMGEGSSAPPVADKDIHFPSLVCIVCNAYTGSAAKPSACSSCTAPPAPVDCNDKYTTRTSCDADAACTWCLSGAVPPACNTLKDAKGLPPGVFTCDHKEEESMASLKTDDSSAFLSAMPMVGPDGKHNHDGRHGGDYGQEEEL